MTTPPQPNGEPTTMEKVSKSLGWLFGSLTNRIIMLTATLVLISTLAMGGYYFLQIKSIVFHAAIDRLPREANLLVQHFKSTFADLRGDAQILSETPPIMGILRSAYNSGIDPLDGSSIEIWRDRLATIFNSLLEVRPHYFQVRYIGVADGGRELVRVDRTDEGIVTKLPQEMQQKRQETYFREGLKTPKGGVHFSDVTYNREYGKVTDERIPTVRVVIPVYDTNNVIFGMIVINAKYDMMLERLFADISPEYDTLVINHNGDYLEYLPGLGVRQFEMHTNYTRPPLPIVGTVVRAKESEAHVTTGISSAYFVRTSFDTLNPDAFIAVAVRVPHETLLLPAYRTWLNSMMFSGTIIVTGCLLVALLLVRKFTAPLQKMISVISRTRNKIPSGMLPIDRQDEIGELARAFVQNQNDLHEVGLRARAVIDNVVDGLVTIEEDGTVDSFNPACVRIFGYSCEEVVGQNISMLMPQPHRGQHDQYLANYRRTGKRHIIGATRELEGRRKDGSTFPLELAVSELRFDNRRLFSGIVRDISERKQMEVMKDEFISTVNHELRTPLTAIQGALSLLKAHTGTIDDKKRDRLIELSHQNCQRLTRLVNDILDIEKIAAGKMEYWVKTVEIGALVRSIVDAQAPFAEKYDVRYVYVQPRRTTFVDVDPERFTQALVNLLSNAAKFSTAGDEVVVLIQCKRSRFVRISVHDHGPGIPKGFREKIFGKFAQADGSATRAQGGSGLGLNITRSIIKAFGGDVGFTSQEGRGANFFIDLPIGNTKEAAA